MSEFEVIAKLAGQSAGKGVAVVSVGRAALRLESIQFCDKSMWEGSFYYMYRNSSKHAALKGKKLKGWSRGAKIDEPEWVSGRKESRNFRACMRGGVAFTVIVVARNKKKRTPKRDLFATLTVTPKLKGVKSELKAVNERFMYPAGAFAHKLHIILDGLMPQEIGRYDLELKWTLKSRDLKLKGPQRTRHRIYTIFDQPLDPAYFVKKESDTPKQARAKLVDGTVTGTRKRLDHLMKMIQEKGKPNRHAVVTDKDLIDLFWKVHVGLSNKNPPRFLGENATPISVDPFGKGADLPLEDQWLALLKTRGSKKRGRWNDASCAGHVQLAKTMLASVGLLVRPVWVYPKTRTMPDGTHITLRDKDLYALGQYTRKHAQSWVFKHDGRAFRAQPLLMQPNMGWEYYEACMLSPEGRFLTGGFHTRKNPKSFSKNHGFKTAAELLSWWARIKHKGWGKRFMCWVWHSENFREVHCWDVEGTHYDSADYEEIRFLNLDLPLPRFSG